MNHANNKGVHEPFVRIAKRDSILWSKAWLIRALAIVAALVVDALIIYFITKLNPLKVYGTMFEGAFGTKRRIWITVREIMMLLCIGVGLAPAFKMRFWNVGAEGQILVGGIATAACMIYLNNLPTPVLLVLMFIASAVAGAIWGLIPAIFKSKWDTNETLFTLMMNYIAIQLTSFMVSLWENPYGSNSVGVINQSTQAGWFPKIFGQTYLLNVIIVMALTIGMYIYLKRSKQGYEIAVVGESRNTARYAGIDVKKVIIRTMLISGAICGVAGMIGVGGADHTISTNTAGGRGFTAIIVAWMAKFNTITMILITALLIFLDRGAAEIASIYNLNEYASEMIMGIILFFLLGCEFFINYRLIFRTNKEGK
ncbi:MAG: ABC transporter permease [Clostridia bacterium]|nr:ABC transporter permease [Clostridia bacterium]